MQNTENKNIEVHFSIDAQAIPQEIKNLPQWVVWCKESRDGKMTKIPFQVNGASASVADPSTWTSFENAFEGYRKNQFDGIGFVFTPDDPFVGIDLDGCVDLKSGHIEGWAEEIVDELNSYTEVSPSRCGLHIIIKGNLPAGHNRKGQIELYSQSRYFTFTGFHLGTTPKIIHDRDSELTALFNRLFPSEAAMLPPVTPTASMSDEEILERAKAAKNGELFQRLFTGNIAGYDSQSEADAALCSILAFWTQDSAQIDRLFRKSGLYRAKWERGDYRSGTIESALAITTEHYSPPKPTDQPQVMKSNDTMVSLPEGLSRLIADFMPFHAADEKTFVTVPINGHVETYPVRSKRVVSLLYHRYYKKFKKPPNKQSVQDTLEVLEARARCEGPLIDVFVRTARVGDSLFIDLANAEWESVEIKPDGWRIVKDQPVRFLRPPGMLPLPTPQASGSLKSLQSFVNLRDDDD